MICGEWYEDMIDHHSCAHNLSCYENEKNLGLTGLIQTHDLCDTSAVLFQLS